MIEKLDLEKRHSFGTVDWLENMNEPSGAKLIETKINELIDTVNSIVSVQEKLIDSRFVVETKHEEPADPYAEQRKWIGRICEFWDNDDTQQLSYGVLTKIDTESGFGVQYCCNDEYDYDNCQPVKPDDDIIYKGE